jgi:hypothetical protein
MDDPARRSASIYEAVACMPAELCRLIAAYDERRPHTWTINGDPPDGTGLVTTSTATELRSNDQRDGLPWQMFVSESPLEYGHLEWTIELETEGFYEVVRGYVGVGITTSDQNRFNETDMQYRQIAKKTDWIMVFMNDRIDLIHKGTTITNICLGKHAGRQRMRVLFTVDPKSGTVNVRWTGNDKSKEEWTEHSVVRWLANGGNETPVLSAVRPCVSLCGTASAVVRSGPAGRDFPADVADFVLTTAAIDCSTT